MTQQPTTIAARIEARVRASAASLPYSLRRFMATAPVVRTVSRLLFDRFMGISADAPVELGHLGGVKMRLLPNLHRAFVMGTYEPEVAKAVATFAVPGAYCVDIGAHLGYFALDMARRVGPTGRVWAFEPSPGTARILTENLGLNGFEDRATVEQMAVSNEVGEITLHVAADPFAATSSLSEGAVKSWGMQAASKLTVRTMTLDGYFAEAAPEGLPRLDLLLIDTEGAEGLVLQGARALLKRYRPVIVCEMHNLAGSTFEEAERELIAAGYTITVIDHEHAPVAYHVLATPK